MSPRRRPPRAWPWPQDTALERREKVAHSYRAELARVAPDRAGQLDQVHAALGQTWVLTTRRALPDDELLDTAALAEHFDTSPRVVDQWRRRDGLAAIATIDGIRFRYSVVVEFLQQRRVDRRSGQRAPDTPGDHQHPRAGNL